MSETVLRPAVEVVSSAGRTVRIDGALPCRRHDDGDRHGIRLVQARRDRLARSVPDLAVLDHIGGSGRTKVEIDSPVDHDPACGLDLGTVSVRLRPLTTDARVAPGMGEVHHGLRDEGSGHPWRIYPSSVVDTSCVEQLFMM